LTGFTDKKAGNYIILEKLGDGGFATVFLAQHSVLEKKAAVKFLLEDWVDEPDVVARFFDEARTMERLHQHPNIVKILDIATQEKCASEGLPPYFIMEYIDGKSLEDIMKSDDCFTLEDVIEIMSCALSALQHCHNLGVVHRDIKPSNILINAQGEVKLTDFGIAKARKNTSKTGEGLTLGSTDYMSPEQALGKRDLDYRSDIYSLGITLYQMVCDRLPFEGESPNAVALKHIQEEPKAPIQINEAVPRKLNDINLKAIEKDREHRFQSCDAMLEALKKLDEPEEEVMADVPTVDLTQLEPGEDDESFEKDYDITTSTHPTSKFASKPPVALINSIRVILIVLGFTGLFLALFKGYYLLTQSEFKIQTRPSGAMIYLNGENIGSSPVSLTLPPMGYLVSLWQEGFATSTLYFDLKPRQKLKINRKLLELNPDFGEFETELEQLRKKASALPSSSFKTKKERERYKKAKADLDKQWQKVFKIIEKNIHFIAPALKLVDFAENHNGLERLEKFFVGFAKKKQSAPAYAVAAIIQRRKNNPEAALKLFMEAWTIDPNCRFLLNALGEYFIDENKPEKAKQYLEMSLFLYPKQKDIKEKLAGLK
jgi:serine/threonine protein kinase